MWWLVAGWGATAVAGLVLALVGRARLATRQARHEETMRYAERRIADLRESVDTWQRTAIDLERASWAWNGERKRLERIIADKTQQIEELRDELPRLLAAMDPAAGAVAVGAFLDRVLSSGPRAAGAAPGASGDGASGLPAADLAPVGRDSSGWRG